ncbi:pyruvate/2-oxoglutarate dehydrogenase complex dihydrolipoamide dehydrogenase (E3) component [Micromonospora kangleipakensis]|uniref:Pyruvate/2-oxoglutarate dehydrogenase complex dihydrolipoamide dehydrogenase (E3) component n=1 Tax=Micromonospora kangleipakensis TaxID=1077942 RepID=A0A4Q8B6I5_9ACTN|nr:FAD-dependent oxidoreductase [Micromonospora kangleipakensis]RZU72671.1 pyruvate/2-oxoglutarate dehydrogenase complex dihydrolipoamide dehydrogenase (E3) component [Micromonospora kangleipakensis]
MAEPELVDVVVVGLGVGGEEVAERLAEAGLDVVGIERDLVGGECPYWGCVPSKMMIRAANALAEARRVNELAGAAQVQPDWAPVAKRIREEATDTWDDKVAVDRFVGKGGRFVRGSGRLDGPGRVRIGDQVFQARYGVVLGTGTRPSIPPIDGLADTPYWTNHQAIEVEELPESLLILGGGAIGLELAQVFARFGVRVTVVEAADRVLAVEEPEASEVAAAALQADGVIIATGVKAERVSHDGQSFTVHGGGGAEFTAERLLVVTGRKAHLDELGLETVDVDASQRYLPVDERMHAADGIWAVGDLTGEGAFTHIAMYQAAIVVADVLDHMRRTKGGPDASGTASVVGGAAGMASAVGGAMSAGGATAAPGSVPRADYRALPRVTFTDPEIGAVGLTEKQARERGINLQVGFTELSSSARGWIHKAGNEGFIKLIADADQGVLIGATSAGPAGGEVLSALVVAVHAAVPLSQLRHMIYAYPTFHRAIEDALRQLK